MRTRRELIVASKRSNTEKLESFKHYVLSNKNKISYKTYVMFNGSCQKILDDFLTTCETELILDLKEHTIFLGTIYKYIKQNNPNEQYLPEIKTKFKYYKEWIIRESDMEIAN